MKEEEKRKKEQLKLEKEKEKEKKKKEELRLKNQQKSLKNFKVSSFVTFSILSFLHVSYIQQFELSKVNPLFTVVVLEDRPKSKEHLPVIKGEKLQVILIAHNKLPRTKYLVEKEDGISELYTYNALLHVHTLVVLKQNTYFHNFSSVSYSHH